MRAGSFLILSLICLFGCGVKAPPIAPERRAVPQSLKLDCSPTDPDCDKTDPNYKPQGR